MWCIDAFKKYFESEYKIIVDGRISKTRQYEKIYVGPKTKKNNIFLRYEDNHYDVIDIIMWF